MTKNPINRWSACLFTAGLVSTVTMIVACMAPSPAVAGTYEVVQCDRANRAFPDARFHRVNGGDYGFLYRCEEDEDGNSLQIRSITGSPKGRYGRISWSAPAGGRIVAIDVEGRLRSDAGHEARLSFLGAGGGEMGRIATGREAATGFRRFSRTLSDGGRPGFAATLTCTVAVCPDSDRAKAWIRSVRLKIQDGTPPVAAVGGSLLTSGWHRGGGTIGSFATDVGSGVRRVEVRVNGTAVPPSPAGRTRSSSGALIRAAPTAPPRRAATRCAGS